MTIISKSINTNWSCKFVETLLTTIALFNWLRFILEFLPEDLAAKLYQYEIINQIVIPVILATIFTMYWHEKEKKAKIYSDGIHAWFRGILRYWLAFSISVYGFAKIFQTQFQPSIIRQDMLVGGLNGFALTWNFFSYSYTFAFILGLIQIVGSIFLLFRTTTLLGVVILLPVMINIVLINVFYQIAFGAFLNSVLFTAALLFILLMRWSDLKRVFLDHVNPLPKVSYRWIVYLIKVACIVGAAALIWSYVMKNEKPPKFAGKWKVDFMVKNGDTVKKGQWLTDSTAWTTVYIESANRLYLCPNPFLFERERSLSAKYKFVPKRNELKISSYGGFVGDTSILKITKYQNGIMIWKGIFSNDTLEMHLRKVEKLMHETD